MQSLTEKEKALNENVKTLEVEVAIQKLEERIRAERKAMERLNSRTRLTKTLRGALHRNLWIYLG